MTTQTVAQPDVNEDLDLSDLDLLDDPDRHIFCSKCHAPGVVQVGTARCGKRGLCHGKSLLKEGVPTNICTECAHLVIVRTPCPRCGA